MCMYTNTISFKITPNHKLHNNNVIPVTIYG